MADMSDLTSRYADLSARRAYTHHVIAKAITRDEVGGYLPEVTRRLGSRSPHLPVIEKAAVAAISTADAGLDALGALRGPWADLVRRSTILGRMGAAVRYVPASMPITVVDSGTSASFVAEGAPIPVAKPSLTDAAQTPNKVALIIPFTKELLRATDDRAAILLERSGSRPLAIGEDGALLDGGAAVTGSRPASILEGVTPLSGGSGGDVEADVLALLRTVRGGDPVAPFFIASPSSDVTLMGLRHSTGERIFPDVTFTGGSIYGIPLLISVGAPDATLTLVDADGLLVTDSGVAVNVATQAAFQFDSAPSAGAAANVSLFQTNAIAFRFERWITWRKAWSDTVAYMELPAAGSPA